ncbi:hypothetical protein [Siphonobacter sp. SORGH_AS_0500]|uniref:hypothetical protein n=1 Tax=Siphonobacter sp. SORGH_AS_0500 TaxID=1864824 RepID=UPI000CA976A6|nr:hypothetical protein [Siphonobacter sp. SORGH_AS_0500]MDR6194680.1 hypothetical protein [Siphonobacter sp. SORGH_AS_0500]PKK35513.1 hypothetical protein BWI96_16550 [Siphonobacter sp. SORGH_AS_0500]
MDHTRIAFLVSNSIAISMAVCSLKNVTLARYCYAVMFFAAAIVNAYTAFTTPEAYQSFADFAFFSFYKVFINGFFKSHATTLLLFIVAGQLVIAISLVKKSLTIGCWGGILFFFCISPLGFAAAFPSPLFWIVGLFIIYRKSL